MNPKQLEVYNLAQTLAVDVSIALKSIPNQHGAKKQILASSSSVFANLAEFCALTNRNQKLNKLQIAIGENMETTAWIEYLQKTGELSKDKGTELLQINTLIRKKLYALKLFIEENKKAFDDV